MSPAGEGAASRREPVLSVVIVAGVRKDRARRAVASVLEQKISGEMEVIVVDLAETPDPSFPPDPRRVRLVRLPKTTTFGEARAHAVALVRAPVVAFLEEHCRAHPGWARALAEAHRGSWACIGPEVHSMNPGVGWSDAVYLLGYSQWIPPAAAGETTATVAHNSSYKLEALRPLLDQLPTLLLVEPLLQAELLRRGGRLYVESSAKFDHQNETGWESLRAFYWWNRCLGRVRTTSPEWTAVRKIAYTLLCPIAPPVRAARQSLGLLRKRPEVGLLYLRQLPRILVMHAIATLGIVLGSWLGSAEDDRRFTELELGEDSDR